MRRPHRSGQAGFSLLETLMALGILAVVAAGVLPVALLTSKVAENQGRLASRTTRYAQDKIEQLLALEWDDATSNTTVSPPAATGGVGLAAGGSLSGTSPAAGYADYLDVDGNPVASANGSPPAT